MSTPRTHETLITVDPNGVGKMHHKKLVEEFLKLHPNSQIFVTFKKKTKGYSSNALRYYWAEVVTKIQYGLRSLGHDLDKEQTHELMKTLDSIFYDEDITLGGNVIRKYKSVRDLSGEELGEHIENMKRFAAQELSILIHEPE